MNTFYDLKIFGKETIVSNFLSWILNPQESHNLGDEIISNLFRVISFDKGYDSVNIIREYYGKVKRKNTFIDIVIEVLKDNQLIAVIAIENKLFSREGYKQTQRYWELLNEKYDGVEIVPIYLTLENMPIELSSSLFRHIKYNELGEVFSGVKGKVKLVDEFLEAYVDRKRENEEIQKLEANTFKEMVNYIGWNAVNDSVCRMISYILNDRSSNMLARYDYSARGGKTFFCITSKKWDTQIADVKCNIHLEGDLDKLVLHFEVVPYRAINKLNDEERKSFGIGRAYYRDIFTQFTCDSSSFNVQNINGNDTLTVYKLSNCSQTFLEYLEGINYIFNSVDQILTSHNTAVPDIRLEN